MATKPNPLTAPPPPRAQLIREIKAALPKVRDDRMLGVFHGILFGGLAEAQPSLVPAHMRALFRKLKELNTEAEKKLAERCTKGLMKKIARAA